MADIWHLAPVAVDLATTQTQKSLSFNWLFCFRWRASCQQKQILLILTKLQNMKGNGRSQFFSLMGPTVQFIIKKSASPNPTTRCLYLSAHQQIHIRCLFPLHLAKQQPLPSSGACEISHSFFTTHLLICTAPLFPFLSPSRIWNPSILGCQQQKDAANHLQAMAVTIFCEQFAPLRGKLLSI